MGRDEYSSLGAILPHQPVPAVPCPLSGTERENGAKNMLMRIRTETDEKQTEGRNDYVLKDAFDHQMRKTSWMGER